MSTRSSTRSRNREAKRVLDRMTSDEQLARRSKSTYDHYVLIHLCLWWYEIFSNYPALIFLPVLYLTELTITTQSVFFIGCFGLPFLWFANILYFRKKMFDYRSSQSLRRWLLLSLTGFIISTAAILSWIIYFQITAKSWDVNYLVYFPAPPYNSTNSTSQTSIA